MDIFAIACNLSLSERVTPYSQTGVCSVAPGLGSGSDGVLRYAHVEVSDEQDSIGDDVNAITARHGMVFHRETMKRCRGSDVPPGRGFMICSIPGFRPPRRTLPWAILVRFLRELASVAAFTLVQLSEPIFRAVEH